MSLRGVILCLLIRELNWLTARQHHTTPHTRSQAQVMIQFMLLFSKQAKPRLQKWFTSHPEKVKKKMFREVTTAVLSRGPKTCSFIEHKGLKLVYKRYASLYFCCGIGECQCHCQCLSVSAKLYFDQMKETTSCWPWRSSTTLWSSWTNTLEVCASWTLSITMRRLIW